MNGDVNHDDEFVGDDAYWEGLELSNLDDGLGLPSWEDPHIAALEHVVQLDADSTNGHHPADEAVERPRTLTLRWVSDALDTPAEEVPEIVRGLIAPGELTAVVAPRAVGKSWFAMNLAALLSEGEGLFLGRLPVQRQARTLIAQGELNEAMSRSRWGYLLGDKRPAGVAESFDRWRLRTVKRRTTARGDDGESWSDEWYDATIDPRLERTIVEGEFDVLVVDPWAVFFSGSENSNDEVEAALDKLRALSMTTGVAIVIVHHISKATDFREPEDLWRGATRLADWASTRVTILPHYKRENEWKAKGLTRQSARWHADVHFLRRGAPTDDFSIRWEPTTGWWNQWVPGDSDIDEGLVDRYSLNAEDVARACIDDGGWDSIRQAAGSLDVSFAQTRKAIARAAGVRRFSSGDIITDLAASVGTGFYVRNARAEKRVGRADLYQTRSWLKRAASVAGPRIP